MKRTRMLPVLVALSVPALSAAQTTAPAPPVRSRTPLENSADRSATACAPGTLLIAPAMAMRVVGTSERGRMLLGPNDPLIIGAGTSQGLQVGQEYLVRRVVHDQFTPMTAASVLVSIHTAGWVRIVDAREDLSIATVTKACDGVMAGDYLDPVSDAVIEPAPIRGGQPDYSRPARLVLADERRQTGVPGMLMLIDRGSDDSVKAGQKLTVFRHAALSTDPQRDAYGAMSGTQSKRGPIFNVGEATVMNVRPKTSLVRIDSARDAVYVGDLVALHK
jgi:hypothetical protein